MNITHPYPSQEGKPPTSTSKAKKNTHINERSNVEPSLEDRPLVEEREEFFTLSLKKKNSLSLKQLFLLHGKEQKIQLRNGSRQSFFFVIFFLSAARKKKVKAHTKQYFLYFCKKITHHDTLLQKRH